MIETNWHKCHGQGWTGIITPESFCHPAKFSRALIRRIYAHAIEQGYIAPGACVVDPFGGVALGALHAMQNGLHWYGCELEEKFVGLGRENIALWNRRYSQLLPGWGTATLLQGDSRNLAAVLGGAGVVVSSPPYSNEGLGHSKGHYASSDSERAGKVENSAKFSKSDLAGRDYGNSPGQLGAMKPGNHAAVVGSPPFGASLESKDEKFQAQARPGRTIQNADYGDHPGQLGAMVLGSPPYAESLGDGKSGIDWSKQADRDTDHPHGYDGDGYGQADGQLGQMKAGDVQAVLGSPPYAESLASDDPDRRGGLFRDPKRRNDKTLTAEYGDSPGQLGAMKAGAVVGSPPYEKSLDNIVPRASDGKDGGAVATFKRTGKWPERRPVGMDYGTSDGQLGQEKGDTFWQAAQAIMQQCHQILAPGGVAIWVLKAFVRNKQIVDFPGQWQALGEACGFETVEVIRAWLVEDRGAQYDLFGGLEERTVERKSFFRRLYEKKYPGNSIDYEIVLVQRKA